MERLTVMRSTATPAAAPAARTPTAAPSSPAFRPARPHRPPPLPATATAAAPAASASAPTAEAASSATAGPVHVHPRHARAHAGDDLVRDRARGPRPVLGGGLAAVAGAEEHGLVARGGAVAAEVHHELVHGHPAGHRPPLAR